MANPPCLGDGYSLRDEVRLVESVLARELLSGEQFHLVGHSYGGIMRCSWRRKRGGACGSLSLFEPIAFHLLPAGDPDFAELEAVRSEIADRLHTGDAHGGAGPFVDYWSGAGVFAQLREERQSVLASQVPKVLLEYRAVEAESRDVADYRRIDVPTCLVAGLRSPEPAQRLTSMLAECCRMRVVSKSRPATWRRSLIRRWSIRSLRQFVRAVDASERRGIGEVVASRSSASW